MKRSPKPIYDEKGFLIRPLDLLKMYHFTGSRKKKHYMYKQVIERDGFLVGVHLNGTEEWFDLQGLVNGMDRIPGVTIIQSPTRLKEGDYSV